MYTPTSKAMRRQFLSSLLNHRPTEDSMYSRKFFILLPGAGNARLSKFISFRYKRNILRVKMWAQRVSTSSSEIHPFSHNYMMSPAKSCFMQLSLRPAVKLLSAHFTSKQCQALPSLYSDSRVCLSPSIEKKFPTCHSRFTETEPSASERSSRLTGNC